MNRATRRRSGIKNKPLNLTIANKDNRVIIEFSVKIKWFSMGIPEAEEYVRNINDQIAKLKEQGVSDEK